MKRYQSYKPSGVEWIGDIPEEWNCVGTNKVYQDLGSGATPTSDNEEYYFEGGHHWITTTDLNEGIMYDTLTKISDKSIKDYPNLKLYPSGSIYISMYGGRIGKLGVSTFESYCNQSVCVLPKNDKISVKFYYYWFLGFQDIVKNMGRGGGQPNINKEMIKQFPTLKLPLPEQHQIVQFLDEKTELIDKLISTKERKISLLKQQRTSLINQVVTKGLNPNVKMKDSGVEWIGEIPEHWNMVSIKNLVSTKITDGPHETPEWVEEGIPFLSVESVQDNKLDFNKKRGYITEELHRIYSKKCKPQRDDIFIVKSGSTTGKSTIVETDEEFNIWSPLCIVRSNKDKILPRFLFNSIQSFYFRRFIELGWSFGTQPNIGMGVIENLKIVLPPLKEQQPIIDFLNHKIIDIDNLVDLEQKKIDLLKEYRQSLISEVVTGKIKVTQ
jgi:type I restriction enzyme S subunit